MLRPGAYAHEAEDISLVQTHISYVFLTPEFVYKIKKPVDFGFLDFSTLEKRRFFCNEEVRLNSRLAPELYLGVVEVRVDGGVFKVGDEGTPRAGVVVEYAVKMRRIPEGILLDEMIRQGRASTETVARVARAIAAFHSKAEVVRSEDKVDTIIFNIMDNFNRIETFVGDEETSTISPERLESVRGFTQKFIAAHRGLLEERLRAGFIKDCHGDIHVDHVMVTEKVEIFDCIEFSERLRVCDTVADAGFLSMDLEYLGRGDLARAFEDAYKEASKDKASAELWRFYKCYRAVVRGKVASLKSGESEVGGTERRAAIRDAIGHFHLARLYATGGFRPVLVVVAGLTATGKSTLVAAVQGVSSMEVISTDAVRRDVFDIPKGERHSSEFGKDLYSEESTAKVYDAVFVEAEKWLGLGRSVIIDATFSKKKYIERVRAIAGRTNAMSFIVECLASDETVKARMEKRALDKDALSEATYETYLKMKKSFEAIEGATYRVDTSGGVEDIALTVVRKIFGGAP
jgi:hypothetical protein